MLNFAIGLLVGALISWLICPLLCAHQWQERMEEEALRKWEGKTE